MWMKHSQILWIVTLSICVKSFAAARVPATAPSTAPTTQPSFPVAKISEKEAAVLEAALRHGVPGARRDTIFISLGSIIGDWKDPPPQFIKRFDDLKLNLRPASAARHTTNLYRGVEDPETGKPSSVHWAAIKEWVSDTKVRVNVGWFAGGMNAGGSIDVYELRGSKWEYVRSEERWVS